MSTHEKDKFVRLNGLGSPKVTEEGQPKRFEGFCINIEDLDRRRVFFPKETCELLLVRGTTSFCNNKTTNFSCWRKCCVECSNVLK